MSSGGIDDVAVTETVEAEIVSPWGIEQADVGETFVPQIVLDYAPIRWRDGTRQPAANLPPSPNAVIVHVTLTAEAFAALQKDERYSCLWSQSSASGDSNDAPPGQVGPLKERAAFAQFLQARGVAVGEIAKALGTEGRSRGAVADSLRAWLRDRPKGERSWVEGQGSRARADSL